MEIWESFGLGSKTVDDISFVSNLILVVYILGKISHSPLQRTKNS